MKTERGRPATILRALLCALAGLAGALHLGACTLGPDFVRPEPLRSARYTAGPQPSESGLAAGVAQTYPATPPTARWWQAFGSATLDGWVDEALLNNPDLAQSRASLAAARELLAAQIGASELPIAGFSGELAHERAIGLPDFGPRTALYKLYVGVIEVNYNIDLFGGIRRTNEASRADLEMQGYELAAARETLVANLVATALRSAAQREELRATERLVELAGIEEELTRKRYDFGAAPHRDVIDAMHRHQNASAQLPGLRTQWARSRHALAVLLGRAPDDAPEDLVFASLTLPAAIPVSVPSELVRSRPDILAAEASLHAASARVGAATANLFPQLQLTGTWGSESFQRSEFLRSPTTVWGIAAGLTQPLFAGGSLTAQRRATESALEAARLRYRATVLKAFQNVADALTQLDEDAMQVGSRRRAEESARRFLDETQGRYQLGAQNQLAVVQSERAWQEERVAMIESQMARFIDTTALFQAIGDPVDPGPTEGSRAAP
jgi:NodT family efflux transporter outer membrane factor (OMF) lipoprotein